MPLLIGCKYRPNSYVGFIWVNFIKGNKSILHGVNFMIYFFNCYCCTLKILIQNAHDLFIVLFIDLMRDSKKKTALVEKLGWNWRDEACKSIELIKIDNFMELWVLDHVKSVDLCEQWCWLVCNDTYLKIKGFLEKSYFGENLMILLLLVNVEYIVHSEKSWEGSCHILHFFRVYVSFIVCFWFVSCWCSQTANQIPE